MNMLDYYLRNAALKGIEMSEETEDKNREESLKQIEQERENARRFNCAQGIFDSINDPFDVLKLTIKRENKLSNLMIKKELSLLEDLTTSMQYIIHYLSKIENLQEATENTEEGKEEIEQLKLRILRMFPTQNQARATQIMENILIEQEKLIANKALLIQVNHLQKMEQEILSSKKTPKQKSLSFQQANGQIRQSIEKQKRNHFTQS